MQRVIRVVLTLLVLFSSPARCRAAQLPLLGRQIAIDPGHGGSDPGASRAGLAEDELVLDLGLRLQRLLTAAGATVRLTRTTDTDLADQDPASPHATRKRRDIFRRVELINRWQPDLALSLHVNAISSPRWRGAQVFHRADSQPSAELAKALQQALTDVLQNTNRQAKIGDYRILNDTIPPAALVEVGFISNPEEATLLADPQYRERIACALVIGLQRWWNRPLP